MALNVNIGSELTAKQRDQRRREVQFSSEVAQRLAETPEMGLSKHRGLEELGANDAVPVSWAEQADIHAGVADSLPPVLSALGFTQVDLASDPYGFGIRWTLTHANQEFVEAGYHCAFCLKRQTPLRTEMCTPFYPDAVACPYPRIHQPL